MGYTHTLRHAYLHNIRCIRHVLNYLFYNSEDITLRNKDFPKEKVPSNVTVLQGNILLDNYETWARCR